MLKWCRNSAISAADSSTLISNQRFYKCSSASLLWCHELPGLSSASRPSGSISDASSLMNSISTSPMAFILCSRWLIFNQFHKCVACNLSIYDYIKHAANQMIFFFLQYLVHLYSHLRSEFLGLSLRWVPNRRSDYLIWGKFWFSDIKWWFCLFNLVYRPKWFIFKK